MKLFIGLDVPCAKTAAGVPGEHGRIVREAEAASDPEALAEFSEDQPGEISASPFQVRCGPAPSPPADSSGTIAG